MYHEMTGKAAGKKSANSTGIPTALKNHLETRSGFSFDDVRVHYNSSKPAQLQALAYTQGNQVYMGPGQERHLNHELWHVVQQKQGRVRPTMTIGGLPVNDDPGLEKEADGFPSRGMPVSRSNTLSGEEPVQRKTRWGLTHSTMSRGEEDPNHIVPDEYGEGRPQDLDYPLMVYESFGPDPAQLAEIYRQSCGYPGHSVCVLGINQKVADTDTQVDMRGVTTLAEELKRRLVYIRGHEASIVPFLWSPTRDGDYYEVPYFEVRGRLMQIADEETELKRELIKHQNEERITGINHVIENIGGAERIQSEKDRLTDLQARPSKKNIGRAKRLERRISRLEERLELLQEEKERLENFPVLYRWIDRDAKDDGSSTLGPLTLGILADKDEPALATGPYHWRGDATEDNLREYYRKLEQNHEALENEQKNLSKIKEPSQDQKERLSEVNKKILIMEDDLSHQAENIEKQKPYAPYFRAFLNRVNQAEADLRKQWHSISKKYFEGERKGKFYLPESTLLMNEAAHTAMKQHLIDHPKVTENKKQDRESEEARSSVEEAPISYIPQLKVTKPVKNEGTGSSYLNELEAIWRLQHPIEKKNHRWCLARVTKRVELREFRSKLAKMRQSAFDNGQWNFSTTWANWYDGPAMQDDSSHELKAQKELNVKRLSLSANIYNVDDNSFTSPIVNLA